VAAGLGARGINARVERVVQGDAAYCSAHWIRPSPLIQSGCYADVFVSQAGTLRESIFPIALRHLSSKECILLTHVTQLSLLRLCPHYRDRSCCQDLTSDIYVLQLLKTVLLKVQQLGITPTECSSSPVLLCRPLAWPEGRKGQCNDEREKVSSSIGRGHQ
jgi:hypothetical protein